MAENVANLCKNRRKHGKDTASNHGPECIIQSIKVNI